MICYFTIEDLSGEDTLNDLVHEMSLSTEGLELMSFSEDVIVIKYESDSWGDEKDLCSLIAVTLLEMGITRFSIYYEGENGD
jgi:hypothetical protein